MHEGKDVYTFSLRANAKWSNGDPVVAGDFVYSWQRLVDVDLDMSPNTLFEIQTADDGTQFFQELRLSGEGFDSLDEILGGPLEWEVGAFVLREDLDVEVDVDFGRAASLMSEAKKNGVLITVLAASNASASATRCCLVRS